MHRHIRPFLLLTLLLLASTVLASCGFVGGFRTGDDISAPFSEGDNVFTACTEGCRNQGQCGITTVNGADGQRDVDVVLINPENPATRDHGALLESDVAITVLERQEVTMVRQVNSERFNMNFYRIRNAPDTGTQVEGWVHGICVANRAQN